jgi:hypothetical protein
MPFDNKNEENKARLEYFLLKTIIFWKTSLIKFNDLSSDFRLIIFKHIILQVSYLYD